MKTSYPHRYVSEWTPVTETSWSPVGQIPEGEFLVHRYSIAITDFDVIEVWEYKTPEHCTTTYHDELPLGRVGTREFTDEEYEKAYRIIEAVYPDIEGKRSMGRVTVQVG